MIVELKKTRINKTIFNQIVKHNLLNDKSEPLGWCRVGSADYAVFYEKERNRLTKTLKLSKVELIDDFVQFGEEKHFYVGVDNVFYDFKTDLNEAKSFMKRVEKTIREIELKGQFFL